MIIQCPNCDQKNNVLMQPSKRQVVCGKCKTPLPVPSYIKNIEQKNEKGNSFSSMFKLQKIMEFFKMFKSNTLFKMKEISTHDIKLADARNAEAKINFAREYIKNNHIDDDFCEIIIPEIKYWPHWRYRGDFNEIINFKISNLTAEERREENKKVLEVIFKYGKNWYKINVVDKGYGMFADYIYGEGSLYFNNSLVLGLNISRTVDEYGSSNWSCYNITAFEKNDLWINEMKQIVSEIKFSKKIKDEAYKAEQTINSAKNIKL